MKLRIRDNSIRLRLMRDEVARLQSAGQVSARTVFPGGRSFSYVVESSSAKRRPSAHFDGDTIAIHLPETLVLSWVSSEQVSIEGEALLDNGETLRILVEKDFTCLTPREGEDEDNMFPNPDADTTAC